jgi:hypothetical protein
MVVMAVRGGAKEVFFFLKMWKRMMVAVGYVLICDDFFCGDDGERLLRLKV